MKSRTNKKNLQGGRGRAEDKLALDNASESNARSVTIGDSVGEPNPTRFQIVAQGGLIKVSPVNLQEGRLQPKNVAPRGKVAGMSAKSRKRLLERVSTLSNQKGLTFITVTYITAPTPKRAKADLHAFLEHIRRHAPKAAVIWKMEFQKRGVVHFHFLAFNLAFWSKASIQEAWGRITDQHKPFTRIEWVRTRKKAFAYVAKYMAKSASSGFNYVPYPHEGFGRTWGIRGRENLEYAPSAVITLRPILHKGAWKKIMLDAYWEIRNKAAKDYPPIAHYEHIGFTVFCEDAQEWLKGLTVTELPCKLFTSYE